jgi:Ca2+-binding EF-hand superfamily protein
MRVKYFLFIFLTTMALTFLGIEKSRSESLLYGIDINQDGMISMEEWQGNQRTFEERDLNHDQVLSGSELKPGMLRPISEVSGPGGTITRWQFTSHTVQGDIFSSLDVNKDGFISPSEWKVPSIIFNQLDLDHNGSLSREEFYQRIPPN